MYTDYLKPQECGNRTGVRYATLVGNKKAFTVVAEPGYGTERQPLSACRTGGCGAQKRPAGEQPNRSARDRGGSRALAGMTAGGAMCNEKYINKTGKIYRLKFQIRF